MLETTWHGCEVRVRAYAVPRYAWTTASIDVVVDGEPVLQTGGQLRIVGSWAGDFDHRGGTHRVELFWGKFTRGHFPFILTIDDEEVLTDMVPVENATLVRLAWSLLLLTGLTLLVLRLLPLWPS